MLHDWTRSKTIRGLGAALLIHALVWANMQMAITPFTLAKLDWKYLVGGIVSILIPIVKRLGDPDIITGLKMFDKDNY